jgi:hypothetical protein
MIDYCRVGTIQLGLKPTAVTSRLGQQWVPVTIELEMVSTNGNSHCRTPSSHDSYRDTAGWGAMKKLPKSKHFRIYRFLSGWWWVLPEKSNGSQAFEYLFSALEPQGNKNCPRRLSFC